MSDTTGGGAAMLDPWRQPTIRVRLRAPIGTALAPQGFTRDLEMPSVPRIGENVALGREDWSDVHAYRVVDVDWYPDEPDFDVYVVLK